MKKKIKIGLVCSLVLVVAFIVLINNPNRSWQEKNISSCEKINNIREKEMCIYEIAKATSNPDLCESLTIEFSGGGVLLPGGEGGLEGSLRGMKLRDSCFSDIAQEKLDYTLCEKIDEEWRKNYCFNNIAKRTENLEN